MDFTYTETQDMIRDTLSRFLADTYDFETRQKFINSDAGRDPAIWTALAQELGMLGAAFAEEHGGLGGFGSAVAEWLASQKQPRARLLTLGTPDQFLLYTGNQQEARMKCGLDKAGLLEQITDFIGPV